MASITTGVIFRGRLRFAVRGRRVGRLGGRFQLLEFFHLQMVLAPTITRLAVSRTRPVFWKLMNTRRLISTGWVMLLARIARNNYQ